MFQNKGILIQQKQDINDCLDNYYLGLINSVYSKIICVQYQKQKAFR